MMPFLIYIITFGTIFQLLVEVKSQITPGLRYGHTATLINNILYILGGVIPPGNNISPKETFLYLDLSPSFNTNELTWTDLSNNNIVPPHYDAAAIKGGVNNNTIFLYGGESLSTETMALVYTFDNLWTIPNISGIPPTGKLKITPVVNNNGLMYLFGGIISESGGIYTNDMFILDTTILSWKKGSSIDAPSPRAQFGAVFLQNNNIIYMGGFNPNFGVFALDEVYLYDTTSDIWTKKVTEGEIPSARTSFSSVLGLDSQRVIIFGGLENNENNLVNISPENSLYVLDINSFNWFVPKVTGNIPSSRAFHKTVLFGKYMVVTFGYGYTQGNESDILLLDISNNDEYVWASSFEPLATIPTTAATPTTIATPINSQKIITIIIVVVCLGAGTIILSILKGYKSETRSETRSETSRIQDPFPESNSRVNNFNADLRYLR